MKSLNMFKKAVTQQLGIVPMEVDMKYEKKVFVTRPLMVSSIESERHNAYYIPCEKEVTWQKRYTPFQSVEYKCSYSESQIVLWRIIKEHDIYSYHKDKTLSFDECNDVYSHQQWIQSWLNML